MRILHKIQDSFFIYDTPKILHFPSKPLGILNRVIQLTIVIYILVYVIGIQHGYQSKDPVVSAVSAKVKGVLKTDFRPEEFDNSSKIREDNYIHHYNRIWDVTDIVEAETGSHGFFVHTNLVITPVQARSKCPEDPSVEGAKCTCPSTTKACELRGYDCCKHIQAKPAISGRFLSWSRTTASPNLNSRYSRTGRINSNRFTRLQHTYTAKPTKKAYGRNAKSRPSLTTKKPSKRVDLKTSCVENDANIPHSTGIKTGNCMIAKGKTEGTCEIEAWCPVENDHLPLGIKTALLEDTKKFTVLIKNQISFPNFDFRTTNILKLTDNVEYLSNCRYKKDNIDRFCPVFELEQIVKEAGVDYTTLAVKGGIIEIAIHWDCNLDKESNKKNHWKHCSPEYKFRRLDDVELALKSKIGGWNYRYADYIDANRRILYKAYGINFIINVYGEARKFDIVPMMRNIGAGLGLMALSSFICNRIIDLLRVTKKEFNEEFEFIEFDMAQRKEFEQSQNYSRQEDDTSF